MIHKKIIEEKLKEFEIKEFVRANLKGVGLSDTKLIMTPLGEKIIVSASRPGLVVGKKGQFIKKLTDSLKKKFNLENPQLEISEVENPDQDANIVAERIANSLERYGTARFKGVGHKTMESVINAGALGIEILISGKVPSARAKRWRFYTGYMKKCGDTAVEGVKKAYSVANLKSGTVGIQVRIMPANVKLGDKIKNREQVPETVAGKVEEKVVEKVEEKKEEKPKRKPRKKKVKNEEKRNKENE